MNDRERYIAALTFQTPDRIPFTPGSPRESTLRRWRMEGLPEGVHYMNAVCGELGIKSEPQIGRAHV